MASITQTIPSYIDGISEQPDQLKFPGQVKDAINVIPDLTYGLYKRPGAKRQTNVDPLSSVQSGGAWFHYYRDETEGSYIGQIAADGTFKVWRCSDGAIMTSAYGTGGQTAITNYLATSTPENLQFLTLNDTTFVSNRDSSNANTLVATTGTTDAKPHTHCAYLDVLRTENGRQYGLNVSTPGGGNSSMVRATRVQINSDTLAEGAGTGTCPGIGTQVFSVDSGSKKNLIFRITTLGQQGKGGNGTNASDYECSYNRDVTLLHGGEGWAAGDSTTVTLTQAETNYDYTVGVTDSEESTIKADIKAVRPAPTPFDADTAVTIDTILGGIVTELSGTAITATVIGNGVYLTSNAAFNVEVCEQDLMRVMQNEVNDVTKLPSTCKHGYIVKVSNTRMSDEDDYYVKFVGNNNTNGPGTWVECPAPGIAKSLNAATMPIVIQRTATTTFTAKQFTWEDRGIGDDTTNPAPSFVGSRINKLLFFRNRLAVLAGENVILCKPGTIGVPDFWRETALTVAAVDPIDIACSSNFPSDLYDGYEINTGLIVFSSNQQFLLSSDDTVMNPDTAKLRTLSAFNYNINIPPVDLGPTIGFIDNSGKYSRFCEVANIAREGSPTLVETSKTVSSLLPKNIDLITNSRENNFVFFGHTGQDTVYGYRYFIQGEERRLSSWFKWKFNNPIKYHFVVNDQYFFLDTDNFLQSVNLIQADTDPSIDQDGVNYLLHLDNYTTVSGGVYDATTNKTTFTNQSTWIPDVTTPNGALVIVDSNSATAREGRYAECTLTGNTPNDDFTVPGDWSSATVNIGYLYDYQVKFPRIYQTRIEGQGQVRSDVNSSLIVHRVKFNFGKIGLYSTTLTRKGKTDYTEVYESTVLDEYDVSDAPYLSEYIKTIPVYEKNTNVDITLTSTHPAPATLRSMSWEGDYSPKYYRRV